MASIIATSHSIRAPLGFGKNGSFTRWWCSQQTEFRMALSSMNGHVGMMCFEPKLSPFAYLLHFAKCSYHYHDVHSRRFLLFISQVMAPVLSSTSDRTMGPLGTEGFQGSKKVLQNDRPIYGPEVHCAWASHIITPRTSCGMNIDPKCSPRECQRLRAQPSRRLSSSSLATFLETCLSAYRALL